MTDKPTPPVRHFLDLCDLSADTLRAIVDDARAMKDARAGRPRGAADGEPGLPGRMLLMIFERASTRTRVSFEVAMRQLGGSAIELDSSRSQLGRGETPGDTARVLSRYGDLMIMRAASHDTLLAMAEHASIPVINALTDRSHPCQLMADVMTFEEVRSPVAGRRFAWIGDGNNVATSMIHAAVRFGFSLRLACPGNMAPDAGVLGWASEQGGDVAVVGDPAEAVTGADCVYTDTWVSMGQARDDGRLDALSAYQVTPQLMEKAAENAVFMHCLPAHRGEEVVDAVLDGAQSVVWRQAENRLHVQKAILRWCAE